MKFSDFTCPSCHYTTRQPSTAVVHHRCPALPVGAKQARLIRLHTEDPAR